MTGGSRRRARRHVQSHSRRTSRGRARGQATLALDRLSSSRPTSPPHRPDSPRASGYHRLQMAGWPWPTRPAGRRRMSSWTRGGAVVHVRHAHRAAARRARSQFFFITGADAFAEIATWRHYPEVLDLAHFVVIARHGHVVRAHPGAPARARRPLMVQCDATGPDAVARPRSPRFSSMHAATRRCRPPRSAAASRPARPSTAWCRSVASATSPTIICMSERPAACRPAPIAVALETGLHDPA